MSDGSGGAVQPSSARKDGGAAAAEEQETTEECLADESRLDEAVDDAAPPAPKEPWQWDCPSARARLTNSTPVNVVDDIADLYPMFVNDYLDGYGQWGRPVRSYSKRDSMKILCAWLGGHRDAFGKAQEGTVVDGPETCIGEEALRPFQGRFDYHIQRLESGKYLVGRVANNLEPIDEKDGQRMTVTIEAGLGIAEFTEVAFRCKLDPQDPCRYFDPEDGKGARSLCFDDKTECVPAGFSSSVYVIDLESRAGADFGYFHRRVRPTVRVEGERIVVDAGECRQSARLPLQRSCASGR